MHDTPEWISLLISAGLNQYAADKLTVIGYFDAPASKGHHLAFKGGLVTHCVNVTKRLVALTKSMGVKWPRLQSPYLVGMLHDLVKCRCYRLKAENGESVEWEYIQPVYPGHGACSVAIAAELGIDLLRDEIVAITYHMGMYGVGREYTDKEFDNALRWHGAQVIATCCADWYAARVDEEEGAKDENTDRGK